MPDLNALLDQPVSAWSETDVEYAMNHPAFWQGGREATDMVRTRVRDWFEANHGDTAQPVKSQSAGDLDAFEAAIRDLSDTDPDEALDLAIRSHLAGLFRDPGDENDTEPQPEVEVLQEALNGSGDAGLALDGVLGPRTRATLRAVIARDGAGAAIRKLRELTAV